MAPRLRKRQIKVTEEADVKPDDQTVPSSEDTSQTVKEKLTESTEAELKQNEEDQSEQDLQMDIEVKGNAPTVTMSWEKNDVEGADVHTEEKIHSSDQTAAAETTESVNGEESADSEDDNSPSKKTKVIKEGFRVFFGNLNDSKTSKVVKRSLKSYLKKQNLMVQTIALSRSKKFAFVDFATELDLTKVLELNGEVILDKPMKIAKANVKTEVNAQMTAPGVDQKAKNSRCLFLKNVPYDATKESIQKLFRKAISVRFPGGAESPNQGIAFLEFQNKIIAEKVRQMKQGVKIQGRVLIVDTVGKSKLPKASKAKADAKAGTPATNTLLVSNLSDKATEKTLKKVFPEAVSVRIRQSKFRPEMYAFVEFESVDIAAEALKSSQGIKICKKTVKVQICTKPKPAEGKVLSKTLIVMNLADKTTAETLQSAFEGALSARVTMDRETGLSKRFGFVEFETEEPCKAAKEAMEDCEIDGSKVIVAYAKEKPKKASPGRDEDSKATTGNAEEKCDQGVTEKRKADSAPKTPPLKKPKKNKAVSGKRKADSAAEISPAKTSHVINNDLSLFVGNLNNSKQFEDIKNSLATHLLNQSILFQDIRLNRSKKYAFVDFASEMDLTKALKLNGEIILDQPVKITKAGIKSEKKAKSNAPPLETKSSEEDVKKSGGKRRKRGKGQADDTPQTAAEEVETNN
ncbi:unnamed protein product [Ophioblennius macclurei]